MSNKKKKLPLRRSLRSCYNQLSLNTDAKVLRGCICLSHTVTALLAQTCFALKKISVAHFKSAPMVRCMSCFQLSDGLLFALVHLSASISPPARLPLTPLLPGENAQLMEKIIYSCLSPNPRACAAGKWRGGGGERREKGGLSYTEGRRQRMTAPASKDLA